MNNEVKENDIVKRVSPAGTNLVAKVRWVNDEGEAGVTYLTPDNFAGTAQVVDVNELKVVEEGLGDLTNTSTKELIAAITRLRAMRLPKKPLARGPSVRKKSVKSKLDALFAEGGDAFTDIIRKTVKKIREEEK